MKACDEMLKNFVMPGVIVKSRAYFAGMEPANSGDQVAKRLANPRTVPQTKELTAAQTYKGFYTWLSSPKAIGNRKANNVAVISPTPHHA